MIQQKSKWPRLLAFLPTVLIARNVHGGMNKCKDAYNSMKQKSSKLDQDLNAIICPVLGFGCTSDTSVFVNQLDTKRIFDVESDLSNHLELETELQSTCALVGGMYCTYDAVVGVIMNGQTYDARFVNIPQCQPMENCSSDDMNAIALEEFREIVTNSGYFVSSYESESSCPVVRQTQSEPFVYESNTNLFHSEYNQEILAKTYHSEPIEDTPSNLAEVAASNLALVATSNATEVGSLNPVEIVTSDPVEVDSLQKTQDPSSNATEVATSNTPEVSTSNATKESFKSPADIDTSKTPEVVSLHENETAPSNKTELDTSNPIKVGSLNKTEVAISSTPEDSTSNPMEVGPLNKTDAVSSNTPKLVTSNATKDSFKNPADTDTSNTVEVGPLHEFEADPLNKTEAAPAKVTANQPLDGYPNSNETNFSNPVEAATSKPANAVTESRSGEPAISATGTSSSERGQNIQMWILSAAVLLLAIVIFVGAMMVAWKVTRHHKANEDALEAGNVYEHEDGVEVQLPGSESSV